MSLLTVSKIQKESGSTNIDVPSTGQFIDLASAAQGDVLYYNGTDYVRLGPGTSGQHLQTAGAGANPIWAAGGKVLQVQQTVKTDTTSTTSSVGTFADIAGMSVDITPAAASSKVLVFYNASVGHQASWTSHMRLKRDAATPLLGDAAGSRILSTTNEEGVVVYGMSIHNMMYLDSPNTTSSVTYKLQWSVMQAGGISLYLNRSYTDTDTTLYPRVTSTITVMEIGA